MAVMVTLMVAVVAVVIVSMITHFSIAVFDPFFDVLFDFSGDRSWRSHVARNRIAVVVDVVLGGRVC